jgi:hypothetical protein
MKDPVHINLFLGVSRRIAGIYTQFHGSNIMQTIE